jgi:hypothetical protein
MKLMTFVLGLAVASWTAALAAQRSAAPVTEPAHNVFVLTGCLERGTAPVAFKLTRASVIGQAPPRASAAGSGDGKVDDVYELQAAVGVAEEGLNREKLESQVGKRVEVTIRPVEPSLPAPPRDAARKDAGDKPVEAPGPPPQRFTVIKLNPLTESCPVDPR